MPAKAEVKYGFYVGLGVLAAFWLGSFVTGLGHKAVDRG